MLAVDEMEEDVSGDSRNDGPEVQVVVVNMRRERERETLKKRCLTPRFHNGMLQILPPLW